MEDNSEELYSEIVSCLDTNLGEYTDVECTVRRGGAREVNRATVYTVVVVIDGERLPEEESRNVGGAIQQTLSENGFDSDKYIVSSVSQRPELFDVVVGIGIHDQF